MSGNSQPGKNRYALFGCHMGVMKRSFGGFRGKSSGNVSRALKKPPSLSSGRHKTYTKHVMHLRHILEGVCWSVTQRVSHGGRAVDAERHTR